jgi:hypothetical protein
MHHICDWIAQHWPDSVPSLVGALVGGLFVLLGQNRADKQQRKRESRSEKQTLEGVLQALHVELEVFNHAILAGIQGVRELPTAPSGPPKPVKLLPINQDYFVVFNTNASLIGRLQDTDLTEQIIRVYSLSKYLVDLINHHQTKFDLLAHLRHQPNSEGVSDLIEEPARSFRYIAHITSIVRPAADQVLVKIKTRRNTTESSNTLPALALCSVVGVQLLTETRAALVLQG